MSAHDPSACNGQIPVEPGHCRCGDIESVHNLRNGRRASCSRSGCPCRTYNPKEGTDG